MRNLELNEKDFNMVFDDTTGNTFYFSNYNTEKPLIVRRIMNTDICFVYNIGICHKSRETFLEVFEELSNTEYNIKWN